MTDDEPFYSPTYQPPPARTLRRPGELLWTVPHEQAVWTCELKYHGEWGVESQILKDGELILGQRFVLREHAVQWSEEQRCDVERGWIDG